MPASIRKIVKNEQEIFVIDYTNLNESQMMSLASEGKRQLLANNKRVPVLAIFNHKSYVTPAFMRHSEKETREVIHLVQDVAFIGLSPVKKILRGYNFLFQRNFLAFDSEEDAIAHLLTPPIS